MNKNSTGLNVLIASVALIALVCPGVTYGALASASSLTEYNGFESYPLGTTDLGSNWSRHNTNLLVQNMVVEAGNRALSITGTSTDQWACYLHHSLTHPQPVGTHAICTFWLRVDSIASYWVVHLWNSSTGQPVSSIAIAPSAGSIADVYLFTGATSYIVVGTIAANAWGAFYIEVNLDNHTAGAALNTSSMPLGASTWGALRTGTDNLAVDAWNTTAEYMMSMTETLDEFRLLSVPDPYIFTTPVDSCTMLSNYSYQAACTHPDSGTTAWNFKTNATWLVLQSSDPNGTESFNMSGTPTVPGSYWVNLTVSDLDSSDYQNWTIVVVETLDQKIADLQNQVNLLEHQIALLQNQIGSLQAQLSAGAQTSGNQPALIANLTNEISALQNQTLALQNEIGDLQLEQAKTRSDSKNSSMISTIDLALLLVVVALLVLLFTTARRKAS
jgi:hypothetical protein